MSWQINDPIIVPVDFSGESKDAIDAASKIAKTSKQLHLIHILYPLDNASPGVLWGGVTDESREQAVREQFDNLVKGRDLPDVTLAVRFGNPGLEIAEYAEAARAGLIVIPSHGYHGVKRVLLGSVAERVIRCAKCPVLVLRRGDAD